MSIRQHIGFFLLRLTGDIEKRTTYSRRSRPSDGAHASATATNAAGQASAHLDTEKPLKDAGISQALSRDEIRFLTRVLTPRRTINEVLASIDRPLSPGEVAFLVRHFAAPRTHDELGQDFMAPEIGSGARWPSDPPSAEPPATKPLAPPCCDFRQAIEAAYRGAHPPVCGCPQAGR